MSKIDEEDDFESLLNEDEDDDIPTDSSGLYQLDEEDEEDDSYDEDPDDMPPIVPGVEEEDEDKEIRLNMKESPAQSVEDEEEDEETGLPEPESVLTDVQVNKGTPDIEEESEPQVQPEPTENKPRTRKSRTPKTESTLETDSKETPRFVVNEDVSSIDTSEYRHTLKSMVSGSTLSDNEKAAIHYLVGREDGFKAATGILMSSLSSSVQALLAVLVEDGTK